MILTGEQIAGLFGVDVRSVRRWTDVKGCPKAGRGKWDGKAVLAWWLENVYEIDGDPEELAVAKLEYWQAKARSEKVKADLAEGASMAVADFKSAWAWRVAEMSTGLGSIPLRLAPLVAGATETEARSVLQNEIWAIRDKFSRTGKFTPAPKKKGKAKK